MSRAVGLLKLAKAARLNAQAAKLFLEAAEELEAPEAPPTEAEEASEATRTKPLVSDFDRARARRMLRKAGMRVRES